MIVEAYLGKSRVGSSRCDMGDRVVIGRSEQAGIVLKGDKIEPEHAQVDPTTHGWHIKELGGRIRVEGQLIRERSMEFDQGAVIGPYLIKCRPSNLLDRNSQEGEKRGAGLLTRLHGAREKLDDSLRSLRDRAESKVPKQPKAKAASSRDSGTGPADNRLRKFLVAALVVAIGWAVLPNVFRSSGDAEKAEAATAEHEENFQVEDLDSEKRLEHDNYLKWVNSLVLEKDFPTAYAQVVAAMERFPASESLRNLYQKVARGWVEAVLEVGAQQQREVLNTIQSDGVDPGFVRQLVSDFESRKRAREEAVRKDKAEKERVAQQITRIQTLLNQDNAQQAKTEWNLVNRQRLEGDPVLKDQYQTLGDRIRRDLGAAEEMASNQRFDLRAQRQQFRQCLQQVEAQRFDKAFMPCKAVASSQYDSPERQQVEAMFSVIEARAAEEFERVIRNAQHNFSKGEYPDAYRALVRIQSVHPEKEQIQSMLNEFLEQSEARAKAHISAAKSYISFSKLDAARIELENARWVLPIRDHKLTKIAEELLTKVRG